MYCASCGNRTRARDSYCRRCGHALVGDTELASGAVPVYRSPNAVLRREVAALGLGLVMLIAATFAVWYGLFLANTPASTVRKFIESDQANDLSLQSSLIVDNMEARATLAAYHNLRQQSSKSPFQGSRIGNVSMNGEKADVDVDVPVKAPSLFGGQATGNVIQVDFVLERQNGHWKIEPDQTLSNAATALAMIGINQIG